ncbi:MAG: DnaJ domain-containing protein [Chlorobiaceae bacterium]|nr:DnaJ domain-containing protein [Chlorobiaceae bacterium]
MKAIYTHYDNLGVSRNSPDDVIKAAYRILSKKYHPDLNPGNPEAANRMKSINESYRILCDPNRRKLYDEWIREQEIHASDAKPENQSYDTQKNIVQKKSDRVIKKPSNQNIVKYNYHDQIKFVITAGIIIFAALPFFILYEPIQQNVLDYNKSQKKPFEKTVSSSEISNQPVIEQYSSIIPKNFSGDDISELFKEVIKSFPPKDEFEKTDDYKNRFKSTAFHKPYYFISRYAQVASYDIDKQIISINFIDNNETSTEKTIVIDTRKSFLNTENANNAIPEISTFFLRDIRLEPEFAEILKSSIRFRIEPGNGRELKNHLGLLIIATPEADKSGQVVSENLNNEYGPFYQINKKNSDKYIHSFIKSIWVYNTDTGVVYYKKNIPDNPEDEYRLGLAFETGNEQLKDRSAALKWYSLAAKHKNTNAQYKLRKMYSRETENSTSDNEQTWYHSASDTRNANQDINLSSENEKNKIASEPLNK